MRSRTELVKAIITNPAPSADVLAELMAYGWDCDTELVLLTQADILKIFESFLSGKISAVEVRVWANRLERRDDIGYEGGGDGVVNEALFWLANPEINYPIDKHLHDRIKKMFQVGSYEKQKP